MKILVTYAVQGEFTELRFPGKRGDEEVQVGYLRTGIGKVKSAYYLAEAIRSTQPDLVVNIGTAGTLTHRVGEVLVCRRFVDRDMERVKNLGVECELSMAEMLAQHGYCTEWPGDAVCNTGDSFLTAAEEVRGDVVDMEAYAQAFVCRARKVPFVSVKCVTDVLGQNSVAHWEAKLAEARTRLGRFFAGREV
mgnify:CR=1 FL=1